MDFNRAYELLTEAQVTWKKGTELTPEQQKEVKAKYIHRHTGSNKPEWAKGVWKDGKAYPLLHKDDADWLANTEFAVTKTGKLCGRTKYCNSTPTYPNNPELRKKDVKESLDESKCSKCKLMSGLPLDKSGLCPDCKKTINYGKSKDCNDCNGPTCKIKKSCVAKFKEECSISEMSNVLYESKMKDLLNKLEDNFKLTDTEKEYLLKAGLIDDKGRVTKKAKEEFPELFE